MNFKPTHRPLNAGVRVVNQGAVPELWLYDVIGTDWFGEGVRPADVADFLTDNAAASSVLVRLNTPGGIVADAVAIFTLLAEFEGTVDVSIDGIAYSAGAFLAMVGDTIRISQAGSMMIHAARGFWNAETVEEHRKAADELEAFTATIANIFADSRPDISRDQVDAWMAEGDRFFQSDEALDVGLVDEVTPINGQTQNLGAAAWNFAKPLPAAIAPAADPSSRSQVAAARLRLDVDAAAVGG